MPDGIYCSKDRRALSGARCGQRVLHTSRLLHSVHQIRCRLMVFAVRVSVLVLQHCSHECVPVCVCVLVCACHSKRKLFQTFLCPLFWLLFCNPFWSLCCCCCCPRSFVCACACALTKLTAFRVPFISFS